MSDLRTWLFRNRSYTPIPFLLLLLIVEHPTPSSLLFGLLMVIAGEGIRMFGVGYAGLETRATSSIGAPQLVTGGPYAHVRNPLYVGNILLYVGIGVMSGIGWVPLLGLIWFVFQYSMIVSGEEEFLRKEFGPAYADYEKNVPAFIPRLSAWKDANQNNRFNFRMALRSERRSLQAVILVMLLVVIVGLIKFSMEM